MFATELLFQEGDANAQDAISQDNTGAGLAEGLGRWLKPSLTRWLRSIAAATTSASIGG